jgi:excisionase family DNA binding protein
MSMPERRVSGFTSVSLTAAKGHPAAHPIERPFTCEEAGELLRVHPRTIKRMAGRGELPGHFRFGRWFFYPSELDSWMRMELNSESHP